MEKIILAFFVLLTLLFFIILPIENYSNYETINEKLEIKNNISDYKNTVKSNNEYHLHSNYINLSTESFFLPL